MVQPTDEAGVYQLKGEFIETDSQKFKVPRHLKLTEYHHKNWRRSVKVITHIVLTLYKI